MNVKVKISHHPKLSDRFYKAGSVIVILMMVLMPYFWNMALAEEEITKPEPVPVEEVVKPDCPVEDPVLEEPAIAPEPTDTSTSGETISPENAAVTDSASEEPAADNAAIEPPSDEVLVPEAAEPVGEQASLEDPEDPQNIHTSADNPATENTDTAQTQSETEAVASDAEEDTAQQDPALDSGNEPQDEAQPAAETTVEITNDNCADVENNTEVAGNSGGNSVVADHGSSDTSIATGDVNVYANVLNILNSNEINSKIVQITEDFNNLSTNLVMNQPEVPPQQLSAEIAEGMCSEVDCMSLTTVKLTNQNDAHLKNKTTANANSGNNSISGAGEGHTIVTGNVNALVNILNIVNANLINSRWTIATFNVFGDWEGDLVLPSELYFKGSSTLGDTGQTSQNLQQATKVVLNLNNSNDAQIKNNVQVNADSGANTTAASETSLNNSTETGQATAVSNVENVANATIINSDWFLSIVSALGTWTGNVYYLPEEVNMEQTELGRMFVSSSVPNPELNRQFEESIAPIGDGEINVEVENTNTAIIDNEVLVDANSGQNIIEGENVSDSRIITGSVKALANILNFANINLINSNLNIGFLNVFGKWNGNIVFGYPDLSVNQTLLQGKVPNSSGKRANFVITYDNLADTSMPQTDLEWHFDPSLFTYQAASAAGVNQPEDGVLKFSIGRLQSNGTGRIQVQLKTKQNLGEGDTTETVASVSGNGPEQNLENNTNHMVFGASANYNDVPPLPGTEDPPAAVTTYIMPRIYSKAEFIEIGKSNDSGGRELSAGETVNFSVMVNNLNLAKVYDATMYDSMKGPNGEILTTERHYLGDIMPKEKIFWNYSLLISEDVPAGTYVNEVWIEGLDSNLVPIKSSVAQSFFKIKKVEVAAVPPVFSATVAKAKSRLAGFAPAYEPPIIAGADESEPVIVISHPLAAVETAERTSSDPVSFTLVIILFSGLVYAVYRQAQRKREASTTAKD